MGIQKSFKKKRKKPLLNCDLLMSKLAILNEVITDPKGTHGYLTAEASKDCGSVATLTLGMTSNKRLQKSANL